MIHKSYLIEKNINLLQNNITLFYWENLGLINEFKDKILLINKKNNILRFNQDDILNNQNNFYNEIRNISLFDNKKVFLINDVNDKFLRIIDMILNNTEKNKFFLFSGILEKKSKLRSLLEKENKVDVIPCYQDNNLNIKKKINIELKNYIGLDATNINLIADNCSNNRSKLKNEIQKIKIFFTDKIIKFDELEKLLNLKEDDEFNSLKDSALNGDIYKSNKLIDSTFIEAEKTMQYLINLNNRLSKLKLIVKDKANLEQSVNDLKPPVFWKDKPNFIKQAQKWNRKKLNIALKMTYQVELTIKCNSLVNKKVLFKKLILDICNLANAA